VSCSDAKLREYRDKAPAAGRTLLGMSGPELVALIARLDAAERVIKVSFHRQDCPMNYNVTTPVCDCGRQDALSEWRTTQGL
jgi:hypothetical protein